MNNGGRPHGRTKTVGSGSAGVGRGRRIGGTSGPVGGGTGFGGNGGSNAPGGRGFFSGGSGSSGSSGGMSFGGKFNFKTIIIIAVLIIGIILFFKVKGNVTTQPSPTDPEQQGQQYEPSAIGTPDTTVSPLAREKLYKPEDGDKVTVMVYMCGTDLESKYGMATKDLNEMLGADISDNVNLLVLTGGCSKWQNNKVSSARNQIFKLKKNDMETVVEDFGSDSMTSPENLTRFIDFCENRYPADRNILIFWDHGGGTVSGFGYDEKDKTSSPMTLSKIGDALEKAGCKFDFIGFDACLMATLETDIVCAKHADYLIASEETEPGTGWYYTNWLNDLSRDTDAPTVNIAARIIDDFISSNRSSGAGVTLSVVDLAELEGTVPASLKDFASSTAELVKGDGYKTVSDARAGVRQFSQKNKLNQIDLIDLADRMGTAESKELAKTLRGCVKYNRSTIERSNGISVYFPYETTKTVGSALAAYDDIGENKDYAECASEYAECIKAFASLEYGGQIAASATQVQGGASSGMLGSLISSYAGGSSSPIGMLSGLFGESGSAGFGIDASSIIGLLGGFSGRSVPGEYGWVDTGLIADKAEDIADSFLDPERIVPTEKEGRSVLELTDKEWSLVETVELNIFAYDGEGYIDLGLDNVFEWYDNDSMLLESDGTWLTLNGHVCAYYLVSDIQREDGSYETAGRIPAILNGTLVNLSVVFNDENPKGKVIGAYPMYEDQGIGVEAKGNIGIEAGDEIELLCDYYDLDGNYSETYSLGDPFTLDKSPTLINLKVDAEGLRVTYRLTDIYGNHFWVNGK